MVLVLCFNRMQGSEKGWKRVGEDKIPNLAWCCKTQTEKSFKKICEIQKQFLTLQSLSHRSFGRLRNINLEKDLQDSKIVAIFAIPFAV